MALLRILKGATSQGQNVALDADKVVLGRNPDCHVVITGTAVSRAHAHIVRVQGKFFIEDMKSRNGTFVNNTQIAGPTQLANNDRIKICDFMCTFHDGPPAKPLPDHFRPEEPGEQEEGGGGGIGPVEAAVSHSSSHMILETQPKEKIRMLLEITTNLSKTLELDSLMPRIVESLFHLFKQADRCFIILQDEATKKLIPKVIKTRRAQDESNARFSRRIVNQCMDDVQAILSEDATSDSRFAMSQSIADFRIRSVMCAPFVSQEGKGFGVIQLDTQDRTKKFTQDDLKLLMGVAAQASVALENAKLHEDLLVRERLSRDLELAREVQRGFLPMSLPAIAGYEFFAHYESAQHVGGDYYDFIPLPQGKLAIMLGDVAGKGVPAALMMAKISSDARFSMLTEPTAAAAVVKLNDLMHQAGLTDRFVTLAVAVLDPTTHKVTFVNAGHPSPLICRAGGAVEEATSIQVTGLPIGVMEGYAYESAEIALQPGESVLVFSDGVTDAMDVNNNQFTVKGIHNALQGPKHAPKEIGERLLKLVKQHAAGRSQHDDLTLVSFGRMA